MKKLWVRIFLSAVLLTLFSACGGGSSSTTTSPGGGYTYSPSSLSFSAQVDANAPASQVITLVAQTSSTEIPNLSYTTDVIDLASLDVVSSNTAEVTVIVKSPILLGIGTHNTTIKIESSEGTVSIPVTFTVTPIPPGNPEVNFISPYTLRPGISESAIIRGGGFSRFDSTNLPTVTIGSSLATNISVVNDSMLKVTVPSLSLGTHAVNVTGAGVTFTSNVDLQVLADQSYSTTSILTSGEKSKLIFDKERRTVYLVNTTTDALERYTFVSGTTWNMDSLSLSGLSDAALSADGGTLVVVDGNSFYEVDPAAATMLAGTAVNAPLNIYDSLDRITSTSADFIGVGSNQWSPVFTYNLLNDQAGKLSYLNGSQINVNYSIYQPRLFNVRDGGEVYFGESGISTSRIYVLDTGSGSITDSGVSTGSSGFKALSSSPDKSRILVNGQDIYNADLSTLLGSLPSTHTNGVLSPDGNTAYVFTDFTGAQSNILRAYDISSPSTPTQIGSDVILANGPGMRARMAISDDGQTLFLGGTTSLEIIDLTTFSF